MIIEKEIFLMTHTVFIKKVEIFQLIFFVLTNKCRNLFEQINYEYIEDLLIQIAPSEKFLQISGSISASADRDRT